MTDDVDEFLAHFGVKGMHWGVRKSSEQLRSRQEKLENKKVKVDTKHVKARVRATKEQTKANNLQFLVRPNDPKRIQDKLMKQIIEANTRNKIADDFMKKSLKLDKKINKLDKRIIAAGKREAERMLAGGSNDGQ